MRIKITMKFASGCKIFSRKRRRIMGETVRIFNFDKNSYLNDSFEIIEELVLYVCFKD